MSEHYVINLGRQLGSGGKEIGEKLAQQLGIAFYDKELINLASEESGLCREFLRRRTKKPHKAYWEDCSDPVFLLSQKEPIPIIHT